MVRTAAVAAEVDTAGHTPAAEGTVAEPVVAAAAGTVLVRYSVALLLFNHKRVESDSRSLSGVRWLACDVLGNTAH